MKLVAVAWLVLPQFNGAAFLYERFVREQIRKYVTGRQHQFHASPASSSSMAIPKEKKQKSPSNVKGKKKFVDFILPKKVSSLFASISCFIYVMNNRMFLELFPFSIHGMVLIVCLIIFIYG